MEGGAWVLMYKKASENQQFLDRSGGFASRPSRRGGDPDESLAELDDQRCLLVERQQLVQGELHDVKEQIRQATVYFARHSRPIDPAKWDGLYRRKTELVAEKHRIDRELTRLKPLMRNRMRQEVRFGDILLAVIRERADPRMFEKWEAEARLRCGQSGGS